MLSLVGELGDGWIPFAHTPESYRKQLEGPIKRGLEKNGRSLGDIDPACIVPASISRNDGESRREAIAIAKTYLVWSYDNMSLIVPGLEHPGIRQTQLKTLDHLSELVRLSRQIPDDVAEELTVSGTPAQCGEKIERFLHAGCRHLILVPIGRNEAERARKMKMLGKVISRL
jgi:alkanesulfonate monooxygenase SsuD/methylene tetrahydromethanopterin reductase-like flavin-dependent oxidoreductase (luciferase family)